MTLAELKEGHLAEIVKFTGGRTAAARMNSFGLYEGGRVRVVRAAPFAGPLLIEDAGNGARMMAARGMAAQVEVREVADDPPR